MIPDQLRSEDGIVAESLAKIEAYADGRVERAAFESWLYELSFDIETKYP